MSTQIQRRRGTTAEHSTFTGVEGELTVDTTKDTAVVHDGTTVGGHPLQKQYPPLGSAAAPTYTFTGDTNTGIFSPSADQVAVATNGTGRLFVDASGRIGIAGSPSASSNTYLQVGYAGIGSDHVAYNYDSYFANNLYKSANSAWSRISTRAGGLLRIDDDTFTYSTADSGTAGASATLSERLRITSAGLVGIGNSSPATTLDVVGGYFTGGNSRTDTDTKTFGLLLPHVSSATNPVNIIGALSTTGQNLVYIGGSDSNLTGTSATTIHFYTAANATTANGTERMRITAAGLVGIGTSSPGALLDINGSGNIVRLGDGTNTIDVRFKGPNNWATQLDTSADKFNIQRNSTPLITLDGAGRFGIGTTNPGSALHVVGVALFNTSQSFIANSATGSVGTFQYNSTSIGDRIDSSGRLGIGTSTPGSYNAYADDLVIANGSGNPGITLAGSATGWGSIYFADGTTGSEPYSGYIQYNHTNDRMTFATAGGLAAMHIDSSQRVGIGTTTPATTLHLLGANTPARGQLSVAGNGDDARMTLYRDAAFIGSINGDTTNGVAIAAESGYSITFNPGGGAEKARFDTSGRLLVGTSSALTGSNSQYSKVVALGNSANNAAGYFSIAAGSARGNDEDVANLWFTDNGAGEYASIRVFADGATGSGDYPGRLVFSTTADGASSPTERMRINNAGSIITFTSTTGAVDSSTSSAAGTTNTIFRGYYGATSITSAATLSFRVYSNGNVENTNNSYGAISDIKLKENIVDANSQWDDLKALQVRNYNFKEGQTHTQIGLVAQEVELVSPGLVSESPDRDEDGNDLGTVTKSVNYSVLYMKAVKALQEAMERIETLEGMVAVNNITIDEQQHQLSTLAARLTALESA
jgi:hypothetical protein